MSLTSLPQKGMQGNNECLTIKGYSREASSRRTVTSGSTYLSNSVSSTFLCSPNQNLETNTDLCPLILNATIQYKNRRGRHIR